MDMKAYLENVEHAATALLDSIWAEKRKLSTLTEQLGALKRAAVGGYERMNALALNAEDAEDVMMATGARWETYFGPDKERDEVAERIELQEELIRLHEFSVALLSGALLQLAKQGISIVHHGFNQGPDGRVVAARQNLKTLILQARNQAVHWEEGKFHQGVLACFDDLCNNYNVRFGEYGRRSLAFDVIEALGWESFDQVKADLFSLG